MRMMALPEIEKVVAEVEKEKEEEAAQKKKEKQSDKKWKGGIWKDFPWGWILKQTKTSAGYQMCFNLCLFEKSIGQVKKTWDRE